MAAWLSTRWLLTAAGSFKDRGNADAVLHYPSWRNQHKSLVRDVLDEEMYGMLYRKSTPLGFTLDRAIQTAVDLPLGENVKIGAIAGDAESYSVFAPLFDGLIPLVGAGSRHQLVHRA